MGEMIRSRKIRAHAKGQPCSLRLPGICNGNPETTVFCHLNRAAAGKGAGIKAHDTLGFEGCSDCHAYYDAGHGSNPRMADAALILAVMDAVCETHVRLVRAGLIVVPQDAPKPASARPVPKRKPKEQRAEINGRRDIPSRPMRSKHQSNTRYVGEDVDQ